MYETSYCPAFGPVISIAKPSSRRDWPRVPTKRPLVHERGVADVLEVGHVPYRDARQGRVDMELEPSSRRDCPRVPAKSFSWNTSSPMSCRCTRPSRVDHAAAHAQRNLAAPEEVAAPGRRIDASCGSPSLRGSEISNVVSMRSITGAAFCGSVTCTHLLEYADSWPTWMIITDFVILADILYFY
jgi:hypothetical protein